MILAMPMILISIIDVPFQIWDHNKKLKMSFQEIKEEIKQTEGSPELKQKIRQTQLSASQWRMMNEVSKANVVITDLERYSVALYYDKEKSATPKVAAKGAGFVALKIQEVASEHNVEIVSSPALARSIYYSSKVNQEIAAGLYMAVAQVLAYVHQLKRYHLGLANKPDAVTEIDIPKELQYE